MITSGATAAFDAAERAMWAGRARAYEASFGRLCAHPVPRLLDAARVAAGTKVLDVGTGTGTAARAARERDARVRAVDADPDMVARARRHGIAAESPYCPNFPSRTESSTPSSATSCSTTSAARAPPSPSCAACCAPAAGSR